MFFNNSKKYFYGVVLDSDGAIDWVRPFPNKEMRDTWVSLKEEHSAMSAQDIGPTKCEFARNAVLRLFLDHQSVLASVHKQIKEYDYEGEYKNLISGRKSQLMIAQLEKGGVKLSQEQIDQIKASF